VAVREDENMELLTSLVLQFGVAVNLDLSYNDNFYYDENPSYHLKLHRDELPVYLTSSYSSSTSTLVLGQDAAKSNIASFGLGFKKEFYDGVNVFSEVALGMVDYKPNQNNVQEVAYTYLVSRHQVEGRPIPVTVNYDYDQDSYSASLEIDNGYMLTFGIGFDVTDYFKVNTAYRHFQPKGNIAIWDEESRSKGLGYWNENIRVPMNSLQLQLLWQF
jgi:hypothetical protein